MRKYRCIRQMRRKRIVSHAPLFWGRFLRRFSIGTERFTRLTNAFSKKLKAACALHFAYYNFCRIHSSLRVTPAMAAGISSEVWPLSALLQLDHAA